ncbi:winged helix-turn-helix transcriptional regulator [Halorussus sp. AFM4]|uniref:winged helix-turn-helix transcriptional regulator n=1 Tax=Halorussus sp. AFM4 TaxID=3421651 RepID=UPI003EB907C9
MGEKTELQRDILITAYHNPRLNQSEIADRVGCSSSYVSTVLNRFDNVDAMHAEIEQLNQDLGFDNTAGLDGGWNFDDNPDWHQGEDFDADLDQAIRDGVEGLKVLSKKTKGLIDKIRD